MTVSLASITFDSPNPEPLARWWAERFDAEIIANMDGYFLLVAGGSLPAQLAFQKVEDPTPGKNKVHVDLHTDDDLDAEVDRWVEAGATSWGGATPATSSGSPSPTRTGTSSASPADRTRDRWSLQTIRRLSSTGTCKAPVTRSCGSSTVSRNTTSADR